MKRIVEKAVPLAVIHVANAALLAILMVGVPAVTGVTLGSLRFSSDTWLERLIMGGLGLGVLLNALVVWTSGLRRQRSVCRGWMALHALILFVAVLAYLEWIDFEWLREILRQAGRLGTIITEAQGGPTTS